MRQRVSNQEIKFARAVTTQQVEKLKKNSPVGTFIKFYFRSHVSEDQERMIIICGEIEAVYNHTFKCNGQIYQWKDYAIGYIY